MEHKIYNHDKNEAKEPTNMTNKHHIQVSLFIHFHLFLNNFWGRDLFFFHYNNYKQIIYECTRKTNQQISNFELHRAITLHKKSKSDLWPDTQWKNN